MRGRNRYKGRFYREPIRKRLPISYEKKFLKEKIASFFRPRSTKIAVASVGGICVLACVLVFFLAPLWSVPASAPQKSSKETSSQHEIVPTAATPEPTPVTDAKIIVLDAGHGGVQPGCVAGEILEKNITLEVTLQLESKLEEMGFSVVLTRDSDEDIELDERADIANRAEAECFVSLHCNWYEEDSSVSGLECYYFQAEESKRLAALIAESTDSESIHTRDIKEENFQVLRETKMPATLIEMGFMTNPEELELLTSDDYQEKLVSAIANGIQDMMEGAQPSMEEQE